MISLPRRTWGGASTMAVLLARGLSARRHRVTVLCSPHSPLPERLGPEIAVRPVLRGRDVPVLPIVRCATELRRLRPDVLLSVTSGDLRMGAPAARLLGIPVIALHVTALTGDRDPVGRRAARHLPARHVVPSEAVRRVMLAGEPWIPPDRIVVIPNGVDPAPFTATGPAALGLPDGAVAIGYVGRLAPEKGLDDLAAAWRLAAGDLPRAYLVIVGGGEREPDLRRRLAGLPRVRWLGYRSDVPAVLRALDALVLPSHSEAFGLAALEAMAAGLPVVASDVDGLAELVRDGVDGIRVPPRSPERLAEALVALARDPARRAEMGRAGRERATREFSAVRVVERYEALIQAVTTGGHGPG